MATLLCLIIVANSAPVLIADLMGRRCAWPIDGGCRLRDGRPLFGSSKTWRGLLAAIVATTAAAALLHMPMWVGALAGLLAMAGDLAASFTKRRCGLAAGDRSQWLDGLPEALLPALGLRATLSLDWPAVLLTPVLFALLVRFLSPLLYRLHVRQRPW